jgi:hypothetical protein
MRKIVRSRVIFIVGLFVSGLPLLGQQAYQFKAADYVVQTDREGFQNISIDGFFSYGIPGYPDLPSKIYLIAVPADAELSTLVMRTTEIAGRSLGSFRIRELPALETWADGQQTVGDKADCYTKSDYFPEKTVELLGSCRMRKWKIVRLKYTPFRYNPVTQELIHVPEVEVRLSYARRSGQAPDPLGLADGVMNGRAARKLWNFDEARTWYVNSVPLPRASAVTDFVIITTTAIQSASTKLADFVNFLIDRGHNPLVVTETSFSGLTGQSPNGTAEKIRQWLINNYLTYGIEYVLLIGNPDPSSGNIPMKMCWPRYSQSTYREAPTDYFYADLTGNWDLDGDGNFGEYPDDDGTGGVDFMNEVYVGRIPVYSGVASLDSVLQKTLTYGSSADLAWRKSALLPMSFSDSTTDGAWLSEAMIADYLTPAGFSDWTMYMQGSQCPPNADSSFASDQELTSGAVKTRWMNNPYGMVWWWGHGSETTAALGYSGCGWGTILSSSDASSLNDNYPSFVYQCSCLNGSPEYSNNLGTALLYKGAIGTVSASRVSWYAVTSWSSGLKYYCDNASVGYYYAQALVAQDKNAAVALYDVKSDMGANGGYWGGSSWMNLFDFNLYGSPTAMLLPDTVTHTVSTPSVPDGPAEGLTAVSYDFTSGGSSCNLGHALEFRYEWGDGSFSGWASSADGSHAWSAADTHYVRVQARCSQDTNIVSEWSSQKMVVISAGAGPYTLQILASSDGTTNPVPGSYPYDAGETASVQALPSTGFVFAYWEGNVPDNKISQNPLSLTMDGDKTITPHFMASNWSSPSKNLSQTAGTSATPRLAISGSSFYTIWVEDGFLYYKRSTNGGTTWGTKVPLTSGGDVYGGSYGISIAASGSYVHIVMSWREGSTVDHEIYYCRSTNGGSSFGSWVQLTDNSNESRMPDLAISGSSIHIVYADEWPGNWEVMYKRISDYGSGSVLTRRLTYSVAGVSYKPRVAVSEDGSLVHVVYVDNPAGNQDIYYKRLADSGSGEIISRQLTSGGGVSRYPDIDISRGAELQYVFIVYIDDWAGNNEIIFQRLAGFGTGEIKISRLTYSTGDSVFPTICAQDAGENVYVAYADLTPGHWTAYIKKIPNHGQSTWLTKQISYGTGNSEFPHLAISAGKAHIVWQDDSSGNREILYKYEY